MFIMEQMPKPSLPIKYNTVSPIHTNDNVYMNCGEVRLSATHKSLTVTINGEKYYISKNGAEAVLRGERAYTTIARRKS